MSVENREMKIDGFCECSLRDLGDWGTIISRDHLLSSAKGIIIGWWTETEKNVPRFYKDDIWSHAQKSMAKKK
jgi:hypothetical protein